MQFNQETKKHNFLRPQILLRTALGLALFIGLLTLAGLNNLERLSHLRLSPLLIALGSTVVIVICIGLRWSLLTNALIKRPVLSWVRGVRYFLWNRTIGFVIPKDVSDITGRTLQLTTLHGLTLQQAITSVFLDRCFDLLILMIFAVPALFFLIGVITAETTLLFIGFLILICFGSLWFGTVYILKLTLLLYNGFGTLAHRLPILRRRTFTHINELHLSHKNLSLAYFLSLVKFLATVMRFICFAQALEMSVSPLTILMGTPITQLSFLFAFTPGGLGIFEATWYGVLVQFGIPKVEIAPFLIEQRLMTMIYIGILTILSEIQFFWKKKQKAA